MRIATASWIRRRESRKILLVESILLGGVFGLVGGSNSGGRMVVYFENESKVCIAGRTLAEKDHQDKSKTSRRLSLCHLGKRRNRKTTRAYSKKDEKRSSGSVLPLSTPMQGERWCHKHVSGLLQAACLLFDCEQMEHSSK
jgi:hypothetical protein